MRHRIRQRALQELLRRHVVAKRSTAFEVLRQVTQHRVEARQIAREIRQWLRLISTANEKRSGVAKHTRHVPHHLVWRSRRGPRLERCEGGRGAAKRLLRPIGERSEKVLQRSEER